MTNSSMTCESVDAALADYLEGALDDSRNAAVETHLRECIRCAGLVKDLKGITTEAEALPDLVPARDLWEGIEARIAAPVIPLAIRPERQRRLTPAWMGVAAAALVVATAGITYQLTSRSFRSGDEAASGEAAAPAQTLAQGANDSAPGVSTAVPAPAGKTLGTAPTAAAATRFLPDRATRLSPPARMASLDQQSALEHSERVYGKEIAALQQVVSQRKTQLDSATIAIIEQNLQIIDAAIERSKAALAKDPASLLLSEQLTHALDKKVELLRTAALLPAST